MDGTSKDRQVTLAELSRVAREGSSVEQREMFDFLRPHLLRAIRGRLSRSLRRYFDSTDFEQSVWGSLAHLNVASGQGISGNDVLAYVCQIARYKIIDRAKSMRMDIQKRCDLSEYDPTVCVAYDEIDARTPAERLGALAQKLDTRSRTLFGLYLDGANVTQIAQRLGVARTEVYRILKRIAQHHRLDFTD